MLRIHRCFFLLFFLAGALTSCILLPTQDIPTPYPESYLPTVIALTAAAAAPPSPTGHQPAPSYPSPDPGPIRPTASPTRTPIPPLQTPTPTQTFTPTPPPGPIDITSPGPMSKVSSPVRLRGYVIPGDKNLVNVELFGEDGRLIAQNLTRLYGSLGRGTYISLDLPFEIPFAAELARLQVTTSDQHGRPLAIFSVHILLLSEGASVINPPGPTERCIFFSPSQPGMTFRGGTLQVRGRFQPFSKEPAFLELVDTGGKILASQNIIFPDLQMQTFGVALPYQVSEPTSALLILRQADARIPGPFFLYSREVNLLP